MNDPTKLWNSVAEDTASDKDELREIRDYNSALQERQQQYADGEEVADQYSFDTTGSSALYWREPSWKRELQRPGPSNTMSPEETDLLPAPEGHVWKQGEGWVIEERLPSERFLLAKRNADAALRKLGFGRMVDENESEES